MELRLISYPDSFANEAKLINELFALGLMHFHLRKPDWNEEKVTKLLKQIDSRFHSRIVIVITSYSIHYTKLYEKDGGAYLNGKSISVSKTATHADSLLATGFPYYNFERLQEYLKVLEFFMIETRGSKAWL